MKPKKTFALFDSLSCNFPPTPLYRSDLEEIVQIGVDRGLKLAISDDKDEFDDLDDVKENRGNRIKKLTLAFSAENSYKSIDVRITGEGISLRASKDDQLLPPWHDMKSAIEKRVPVQARFMKPTFWIFITLCVLILVPQFNWPPSGSFYRYIAILFPAYMWVLSLYYVKKSGGVYLQKQHEVESFWDKYGEKLAFTIGGVVLGAIGNIVVQKIMGK
ncbi:hypothetical protein PQQ59_17560 [Paraburkholderia aspalathi]|uniref:hypothetical protein n=1 Tax=Paraburkholderia aspalathi TaxID=1324617 RepID=UPI0038B790B8